MNVCLWTQSLGVCKCFQNEHQLFPGTCMDNALYFPSGLKTFLLDSLFEGKWKVRHFNGSNTYRIYCMQYCSNVLFPFQRCVFLFSFFQARIFFFY